jgi:hypothetical protein
MGLWLNRATLFRLHTHTLEWRMTMKTRVMRYLGALGLGAALALSAATASFAGPHDPGCIPQYDSSGAQMAPYC